MIKINQSFISKLDQPLFINGDSLEELKTISSANIDCIITSPPYFNLREDYFSSFKDFKSYILNCMSQCKRVLKSSGSLWLNLGNYYDKGNIVLISYIIASEMVSRKHWILVNDVIWRKTTSLPSTSKKRLHNTYEHMFHFVKSKDYYVNQEVFKTYKRKQNSKTSISGSLGKHY